MCCERLAEIGYSVAPVLAAQSARIESNARSDALSNSVEPRMGDPTGPIKFSKFRTKGGFRKEMNLITRPQIILVFAASLSICLFNPAARGQSNAPDKPIQPLPPDTSSSGGQAPQSVGGSSTQGTDSSTPPQPDTHVLSSGEIFGLGSLRSLRRVVNPSLQFSQSGETGLVAGRILGVSSLGGSLDMA